jgi:hypothetical protein
MAHALRDGEGPLRWGLPAAAYFCVLRRGRRGTLPRRSGCVLAADPGREFAFVTEEGGRESTVWRYRFETVEEGTRVTESYEVRWIPAWARLVDIPTNWHRELHEGMGHTLGRLKTAAEAPSGSPSDDDARPACVPPGT